MCGELQWRTLNVCDLIPECVLHNYILAEVISLRFYFSLLLQFIITRVIVSHSNIII